MTFPAVKLLTYGAKDEEQVTKIMKVRKNVAVECVEQLEQKFEIDEEHFKEV
jgi:antitoxin component HigA of HigAB toxin-antitoxin module